MNFIHTVLAFLIAIGILIAFHELGHYFVARLCNVKVLRFSLGMGKVVFSRRFGPDQTEWVISALPLGGYVKMLDLREQEEGAMALSPSELKREFTNQSVWKRIAIVAAGPAANFLLAIIFFSVLYMVGVPEPIAKLRQPAVSTEAYQVGIRGNEFVTAVNGKPIQLWSELRWELLQLALDKQAATLTLVTKLSNQSHQVTLSLNQLSSDDLQSNFLNKLGLNLALSQAQLGKVTTDGPAMRAGLMQGDTVLKIDGKTIVDSLDLIETVRASPNKLLHFTIDRSGVIRELSVTPDAVTVDGKTIGKLNVEVSSRPEMQNHQDSLFTAAQKATERTWSTSILILKTLGKMVVGEVSLKNVTGPLTIADYAGQTAKIGWVSYISFLALISISLGVMNLLPIPVLDGGHLLYYALEVLTGRPVSPRFMELGQRVGIAALMLLMATAFYNDIVRLLSS
jgi:regulator of sigma E protease